MSSENQSHEQVFLKQVFMNINGIITLKYYPIYGSNIINFYDNLT